MKNFLPDLILVVACAAFVPAHADDLVTNGNFAAGFTGWQQFGDTSFTYTSDNAAGFGPVDGIGGVSQTILDVAGASYTLAYRLANDGGDGTSFTEDINGTVGLSQTDAPAFDFTLETLNFIGTGSDTITFSFYQPPAYYHLTDVDVAGTAPHFELQSSFEVQSSETPEPSSLLLLGTGLLSAVGAARRKSGRRKIEVRT